MSRKYGVPFSIKAYAVTVWNASDNTQLRVKGLETMSVDMDAETDDGRPVGSVWSEKFIKSRGVSGTIEGRPIVDRLTGARDPGQQMLHRAAYSDPGKENDLTLRIADAVGHAMEYDCVVTKETVKADEDGETVSWEWESVGAPRQIGYAQVQRVNLVHRGSNVTEMNIDTTTQEVLHVVFTPTNASNRRFSYYMYDETIVTICAVDEGDITVKGLRTGTTALHIRTMNNDAEARVQITVRQS